MISGIPANFSMPESDHSTTCLVAAVSSSVHEANNLRNAPICAQGSAAPLPSRLLFHIEQSLVQGKEERAGGW